MPVISNYIICAFIVGSHLNLVPHLKLKFQPHLIHQRLTPQIRKEIKELCISSGGAIVGIGEGASISIGSGALIQIGNTVIPGNQIIDTNHPPITHGPAKVEVITWVSFHFSSNDQNVD